MQDNKNESKNPFEQYPALELWWKRLAAGVGGQDPDRPSTWILDRLWRAACCEASAMEAAALDQSNGWRADMLRARTLALRGERAA
jgi:hypothetical protein